MSPYECLTILFLTIVLLQCAFSQLMGSVAQNKSECHPWYFCLSHPSHWGYHQILSIFPPMYNSNLPIPLPPMIIWWQIATAVILNMGYSNRFLIGLLASVLASLQHILHIAMSMIILKCIPDHFTSLLKILFMSSYYSEVQSL